MYLIFKCINKLVFMIKNIVMKKYFVKILNIKILNV